MSRRLNRVEEACKEELSEILQRETKDPRIGFVTITGVRLTGDLRRARVYVSILGTEDEVRRSLEGLKSARGHIRSALGRHLRLKFLPEIEFVRELEAEETLRLASLMREVGMEKNIKVFSTEELRRAAAVIGSGRHAVLFTHENPDGDAVGSVLGLALMLEKAGKTVSVCWPESFAMPVKYRFLPGFHLHGRPSEVPAADFLIALDCANTDRLESVYPPPSSVENIINIDHHPDNAHFGSVNLVDAGAAATAELIYIIAEDLGLQVDLEAARCLYAAIVSDTGRFQFVNTTATTLMVASEMVEMGVDINEVYRNLYQNDTLAYIHLSGKVLSSAVLDEDLGLVYAFVTRKDLERFGADMDETEDLIDSLRSLRGHRIAAIFKEFEDGRIRVSLRSREGTDIGTVARRLGGGGHKVAAGYTSQKGSLQEALLELKREIVEGGWDTRAG